MSMHNNSRPLFYSNVCSVKQIFIIQMGITTKLGVCFSFIFFQTVVAHTHTLLQPPHSHPSLLYFLLLSLSIVIINPIPFPSFQLCAVLLIGIFLDWFLCCCFQNLGPRGLNLIYPQSSSGAALGWGVSLIKSLHTHALITHTLSLKHTQIHAKNPI